MKNTVEEIATNFNITKKLAKEVVDATIASLTASIVNDGGIRISGFGTFKVKPKAARLGRNPKTGESIQIPERKVLSFRIANSLKEALQ